MTGARLRELVSQIPEHAYVEVNRVGNIAITNANWDFIGIVDFNEEIVNWFDPSCHKTSKQ